jgi:hypothetical protein
MYVCIKDREREKEFAFCFIDCQHLRDRAKANDREREGEKRRLAYENIYPFDCLKKYVYVLVVIF